MKRYFLGVASVVALLLVMGQTRPDSYVRQAVWDGANFQDTRQASLANLTPSTTLTVRNSIGAALAEKGGRWTVISQPAVSTVASASIAAEAAVRHVVDCIGFSADAGGAVTAANVVLNVRDGATGAGTVIWTYVASFPTAAALGIQELAPTSFCGLNLVGTTNTAMTFEYSTLVTNALEAVSMSGYNVQ